MTHKDKINEYVTLFILDELFSDIKNFIVKKCKKIKLNSTLTYDDIIQQIYLGCIDGIRSYDPHKGNIKAWMITHAIKTINQQLRVVNNHLHVPYNVERAKIKFIQEVRRINLNIFKRLTDKELVILKKRLNFKTNNEVEDIQKLVCNVFIDVTNSTDLINNLTKEYDFSDSEISKDETERVFKISN